MNENNIGTSETESQDLREDVINIESGFRMIYPEPEQIESLQNGQLPNAGKNNSFNTILLVEDEEGLREITKLALVNSGFKLLQARDGVEALEIFVQHKDEISCLFCDLKMPRMGGWETIYALRAIRQDLPVILSSGYDESSVMAGEHPELPDFFLHKPYDLYGLADIIERIIEQKSISKNKENLG